MTITFFPMTPLSEIDAIEVHGCIDDGENTEQVPDDQAKFWSVYLHYKHNDVTGAGGLDCIADCDTRAEADDLGGFLTVIMKLEA